MSFMKVGRPFQMALLLVSTMVLVACGFHLRENVKLPASIQKVHIATGVGDFQRMLARSLGLAGVDVKDEGGTGIAELSVPVAAFSTDTLTAGGYSRITEYAVRYNVTFSVTDGAGNVVLPPQNISMQREYSYDATNTIGNASEVTEIQRSLNEDMVQAILFRLQAASKHPTVPAATSSTPATAAPAAASSAH